jgi:transcriptional regulator with XRE-family HTH domain
MERRQGNINEFQHYQRSNQLPDRIDLSSQAKPLNLQILSPMARRSLLASPQGIKRAKNALERNNLTQKALANERGIASWSTVNKFFTGKPVDRSIFIEICEELNLNWDEIVTPPNCEPSPEIAENDTSQAYPEPENSPNLSPEFLTVQRHAQHARTALDPYILPRIRRSTLLEKCLKAIHRGVREEKRRVIPIIGSAGYGKSTILGNLYDELDRQRLELGTGWIALVRCNDLIESVETFATELGEKAAGIREPIAEIATKLTQQHGRGILLIDTLDLVLDKRLVPVLRGMFLQLLESGTTVVFTCRDQDFRDFFEPYHESFAGFTESIERIEIPPFNDEEVQAAASAFCQQELALNTPDGSQDFADKIIALSADSQSLADITRNPLLLALLCKLFAAEGNVPEDLTVSQLYELYWEFRIAQGRKNRPESRRIGLAKKNLCLELAQMMYHKSEERLRDFVYQSNLELDDTEFLAYEELLSDGVLQELGGERIGFFHQTFLEYAIARWLNATEPGESAKHQLFNHLTESTTAYFKYYLWPIFRQLLNLVPLSEFYRIFQQLDITQLSPFRAVTFAAISRSEPQSSSVLLQLLPNSLNLGDAYQDTLLTAAKGAPKRHSEIVWSIVIELLQKTSLTLVNKAAEIAGELLAKIETATGECLEQALNAITQRTIVGNDAKQERSNIFGKLISAYSKIPKIFGHGIDFPVLHCLKIHYFRFGSHTRGRVIHLYLTPQVSESVQREFLLTLIQKRTSEQFKEKEKAIELLEHLLPSLIQSGDSPFGTSWIDALLVQLPPSWDIVQAAAVGHQVAHDSKLMATLLSELFKEKLSPSDGMAMRRYQVALSEAIRNGAGNSVAETLLKIPINAVPLNRCSTVSTLIRELSLQEDERLKIAPELRLSLAEWIIPRISARPLDFIPILDALAHHSPLVQPLLEQQLSQIIPQLQPEQAIAIIKKLNYVPHQLKSYLLTQSTYKESRLALIKLYQRLAQTEESAAAISGLLGLCADDSREVALDASQSILTLAEHQTPMNGAEFFPLLSHSKFIGVRHNCLKALIEGVNTGWVIAEAQIVDICKLLANESAPEIVQPLYKLIECWLSANDTISSVLAQATFDLTQNLVNQKPGEFLHSGIARSALTTLKNMANLEQGTLTAQIGECTRQLLRAIDVTTVNKLFVIGILDKLARFDTEVLSKIVREDFVRVDGTLPIANMCAVAVAIGYSQGKNSPLLAQILNDERFPQEVKSLILREQGV